MRIHGEEGAIFELFFAYVLNEYSPVLKSGTITYLGRYFSDPLPHPDNVTKNYRLSIFVESVIFIGISYFFLFKELILKRKIPVSPFGFLHFDHRATAATGVIYTKTYDVKKLWKFGLLVHGELYIVLHG